MLQYNYRVSRENVHAFWRHDAKSHCSRLLTVEETEDCEVDHILGDTTGTTTRRRKLRVAYKKLAMNINQK